MGIDIVVHTEFKVSGRWLHWDHPTVPRDYPLFEKIAGAWGDFNKAMFPPRGLPADVSETTALHFRWMDGDAYSASWLSAAEWKDVEAWSMERFNPPPLDPIFGWSRSEAESLNEDDEVAPRIEDVRVVFWFC